MAALCTKCGSQDKTPKRTFPVPKPGPRLGTVFHTYQGKVVGHISDEKWATTRGLILELKIMVQEATAKEKEWRDYHCTST